MRRKEKRPDREILVRLVAGDLPPDEARALQERLEEDASLRAELARVDAVVSAVAGTRRTSFGPGFADRVMAALPAGAGRRVVVLDAALRRQVRWLLPAAAALLLALGVHNVLTTDPYPDQSAWEAALGLEPVTLDVAFAFDPMVYDGTGAAEGSEP